MRATLLSVLKAVYPSRCLSCGGVVEGEQGLCGSCWRDTHFIGGTVCDACGTPLPSAHFDAAGDGLRCDDCLAHPRPWHRGRAALLYETTGRKLVLALKHGDRQEIAGPAARWMAVTLKGLLEKDTLVAPVPLHWSRMVKRRYNQSALLSKALATTIQLDHCPDLLQRVRRTPSLDGMDRESRKKTLSRAIEVAAHRRAVLSGRPLLIVDDVMTSGATLAAATRAAHEAGAGPVCVAILARVRKGP